MSIKANFVIRSAMTAAAIALVVIPVTSVAEKQKYKALQLVRYALETPKLPNTSLYFHRVRERTLKYDNEYRHPDNPPGPAQVNCANTKRVGVTFYLVKTMGLMAKKHVKMHAVWTHSNVELDDTSMSFYHSHYFEWRENVALLSQGLELTEELKVDGVLTVRVSAGKHEILENSFNLIGCPVATQ